MSPLRLGRVDEADPDAEPVAFGEFETEPTYGRCRQHKSEVFRSEVPANLSYDPLAAPCRPYGPSGWPKRSAFAGVDESRRSHDESDPPDRPTDRPATPTRVPVGIPGRKGEWEPPFVKQQGVFVFDFPIEPKSFGQTMPMVACLDLATDDEADQEKTRGHDCSGEKPIRPLAGHL